MLEGAEACPANTAGCCTQIDGVGQLVVMVGAESETRDGLDKTEGYGSNAAPPNVVPEMTLEARCS